MKNQSIKIPCKLNVAIGSTLIFVDPEAVIQAVIAAYKGTASSADHPPDHRKVGPLVKKMPPGLPHDVPNQSYAVYRAASKLVYGTAGGPPTKYCDNEVREALVARLIDGEQNKLVEGKFGVPAKQLQRRTKALFREGETIETVTKVQLAE